MKGIFNLLFAILMSVNIFAQISINAELRPRTEYRNGYKVLPSSTSKPVFITTQRTRINFESNSEKLNFKISFQDIRTWGEVAVKSDISSIFLNEAWGELHFNKNISLKMGRQRLFYDDQRLLGKTNWNNIGTSHDLALLKYEKESFNIHFGMAYNNEREKNFESFYPVKYYKTLNFLWIHKKINNNFILSFIDILDGNQKDSSDVIVYYRNTFGPNFSYKFKDKGLDFSGNFYYQSGKDYTGTDVLAYFYSFKTNKKINDKLSASIAFEYYSGTDALDTNNRTINTFNKLYGAGHKFAGSMDYFTNTYTQTKNGGLTDLYIGLKYKINDNWFATSFVHYLSLANNVINPNYSGPGLSALSKNLGTEIDLSLSYKFSKEVKMNIGYSIMIAQKSMEIIKGGDSNEFANWAYIMFIIKPKFL